MQKFCDVSCVYQVIIRQNNRIKIYISNRVFSEESTTSVLKLLYYALELYTSQ
jgi:hypothetical protein